MIALRHDTYLCQAMHDALWTKIKYRCAELCLFVIADSATDGDTEESVADSQ